MTPSKLLRRFLENGTKPSSQRLASALLDESRSLLVSKLPTTAETIQNFSDAEIDAITACGKPGAMARAHAIYSEKEGRFVKTGNPLAARPAPAARPTPKPAPEPVASVKPATIHRATATATKPATAQSAKLTTASDFQPKTLRMERAQFNLLSATDKMRFVKTGGKLQ